MDRYVGKRLDGRYEIQELLGVGGMAMVYRAYYTIDDRMVAIKILKEEFLGNDDFIRRFKNESKAIAVLSHPNIVKVYDVSFGDKIQYIVMEYIDGITLKEYLEQQHVIKWKEAVHFTVQILRALQHAHEKGIIHRDIKPQNIMLLQDGTIKVTDFGIARFAKNETRTMTDKAIGSVHYIAPEQARGDITDQKADIYSVGVMLYEMTTGQLPFEADNAVSVAIMQLQSDPRPPRQINPDIPEGLEEITLKAMQKSPTQRYPSAAAMLNDIEQFRRNPSIRFAYKYFIDDNPTKYADAINRAKAPLPEPNYGDDYDYEEQEAAKTKRSPALNIIGGVGIAVVLFALVIGMIFLFQSCQGGEEQGDITIPNFIGKMYEDVLEEYPDLHFTVERTRDATKEDGYIVDQNPESSSKRYKADTQITLTIVDNSVGGTVDVPDVVGRTEQEAIDMLTAAELEPEVQQVYADDTAAGYVKSTTPAPGESVEIGSQVIVLVSRGPAEEKVSVTSVIGMSLDDAIKTLEAQGLTVDPNVERQNSAEPANQVLSMDPLPTTQVSKGSAVKLVVSTGQRDEVSVEVHIELPPADFEVNFQVRVDGELVQDENLVPNAVGGYREVTVKGSSGTKEVRVTLDNMEFATYYVDFDQDGKISGPNRNPNFVLTPPVVSETPSSSSSSVTPPATSSQPVESSSETPVSSEGGTETEPAGE